MMLVDHLDRNPQKQLLRGKIGFVHSWTEHEDETTTPGETNERVLSHMPKAILLDFRTDAWKLPGMPAPGIYPIFPQTGRWHIDAYRGKNAVLAVKRTQFGVGPGFACTAHGAQGKSEKAVIADLQVGRGVASIASYVAITRVTSRKGLVIFRPFDLETLYKRSRRRNKFIAARTKR